MELNQKTLRGILATILSVDESHIVPKQGNWWNPQSNGNVENWCAYRIKRNRPRTLPFYNEGTENGIRTNAATVLKLAEVELQFVGPQSEDIAQSVALWYLRSDVQTELKKVHGSILVENNAAISSVFAQDGANDVLAWNVTIGILWYSFLETGQGKMPFTSLNGKMVK